MAPWVSHRVCCIHSIILYAIFTLTLILINFATMAIALELETPSGTVRLALRIYFTAIFLLLPFLGNQCCSYSVRQKLLRRKRVTLNFMTGWLTGFDVVKVPFSLRSLPAGWLWLAMILSGALALAGDLAVSFFVQKIHVPSRCPFGTGLVLDGTPTLQVTPPNGAPYFVAAQAQVTSQLNGGMTGIFLKANRDLNFRADASDVAGSWNCENVGNDLSYDPDTNTDDIVDDLLNHGYLYNDGNYSTCISNYADGSYSHFIAWDSSVGNEQGGAPFNVRASIDLTANGSDTKVMSSFLCQMDAPSLGYILSAIISASTLNQWCFTLQGSVYDGMGTPAATNTSTILENLLNTMVMVAGSNNDLMQTPQPGKDTQGCNAPRTIVPLVVIVLFFVITAFAVSILTYLVVLMILTAHAPAHQHEENIKKKTPIGLIGWMTQALRESGLQGKVTAQDLATMEFGNNDGREYLRIARPHASEVQALNTIDPTQNPYLGTTEEEYERYYTG